MKLIAASNFRNTNELEIDGALHEKHVHKGARFDIGGDAPFEKLSQPQKRIVAELNISGRIADATNKEIVDRIDKEVKLEKAQDEKTARASSPGGNIGEIVAAAVKAALAEAKPAK